MLAVAAAAVQILFAAGLIYAVGVSIRNWGSTLPPGADSDSEYSHHQHQLLHHA